MTLEDVSKDIVSAARMLEGGQLTLKQASMLCQRFAKVEPEELGDLFAPDAVMLGFVERMRSVMIQLGWATSRYRELGIPSDTRMGVVPFFVDLARAMFEAARANKPGPLPVFR